MLESKILRHASVHGSKCKCISHCLADVGKQPIIAEVFDQAREIVKCISRATIPNALLAQQRQLYQLKRGLVQDCSTRFSSKYNMLHSLLQNKEPLQTTVVLQEWPLNEQR